MARRTEHGRTNAPLRTPERTSHKSAPGSAASALVKVKALPGNKSMAKTGSKSAAGTKTTGAKTASGKVAAGAKTAGGKAGATKGVSKVSIRSKARPRRAVTHEPERSDAEARFLRHLGVSIRRCRSLRGLTQRTLADRARLSSNYVARLERGEVSPSAWVVHCLCEALETEIQHVLDPRPRAPALLSPRRTSRPHP